MVIGGEPLAETLPPTHHTGGAPDVGGRAVVSADQNLHRAVLTRLDVRCEVLVLEGGGEALLSRQTELLPPTDQSQQPLTTQQAFPRSAILMAI